MFKRLIASALVFGLAATAPPALHAQTNCAPRDRVVDRLGSKYSETLHGAGLQSATSLIEVWTSDKTGTWTIMTTRPDGMSCILAHGLNWQQAVPPKGQVDSPAWFAPLK